MRKLSITILALLAITSAARAGLYNLSDPSTLVAVYGEGEDPNDPLARVNVLARIEAAVRLNGLPEPRGVPARVFELRGAGVESKKALDPNSPRALYLRQVEYFEKLRKNRTLGTEDAIALSGAYLRLGDTTQARRVLQNADQQHFLVQAQLAGTYQMARAYELALERQKRALALWPKAHVGWSLDLLEFYRDCERYNLKLLELRKDAPDEHPSGPTRLDPIFGSVRFVNEEGKYAAGELARKELDKLPKNAANVVLQLALWQPRDRRLCWLLAEMLNAYGKITPAARMLTVMVETEKLEWPELRQHQLVLEKAAAVMRQLESPLSNRLMLSSEMMLIPQGRLGSPIAGDVAYYACSLFAPTVWAPELEKPQHEAPPPETKTQVGPLSPAPPLPFNLQHVLISFVFGVLVAALLAMQWQAFRRPRTPTTGPPPNQDVTPPATEAGATQSAEGIPQAPPT